MLHNIYSAMLCVTLLGLAGCGGAQADPLQRVAVTGKVTLDTKPIDEGAISFVPVDGGTAATASGGVITAGEYQIPQESGLAAGNYRVVITSPEPGPKRSGDDLMNNPGPPRKERVAAKYNLKSELQAAIKAGAPNKFDFAVTSK